MAVVWGWVIELILKVLVPVFNLVTPELRLLLNDFLTSLYLKAVKTENPWDDMAVGMLLDILAIPRPPAD
jgi:hypothetical protein